MSDDAEDFIADVYRAIELAKKHPQPNTIVLTVEGHITLVAMELIYYVRNGYYTFTDAIAYFEEHTTFGNVNRTIVKLLVLAALTN